MSISAVSNYSASIAHRNLRQADSGLALSQAKLAVGKRVLSAKDDAAALALGARMAAELSGLRQAEVNSGQASSMLQVAEGGLARIDDILSRMKALAVQAGSDQLSGSDRAALDAEFQSLSAEIERIAADTDFAGTKLLDGSAGVTSFKLGTGTDPASDEISVSFDDASTAALALDGADIASKASAEAASAAIDDAIDLVQTRRAEIGASQNRLDFAAANIATMTENTEAARSSLIDLDVAHESARLADMKAQTQAAIAMMAQASHKHKKMLDLLV